MNPNVSFTPQKFRLPLIKSTTLFWWMINLKDKTAIDLYSVPLCFLPLVSFKAAVLIRPHFIKQFQSSLVLVSRLSVCVRGLKIVANVSKNQIKVVLFHFCNDCSCLDKSIFLPNDSEICALWLKTSPQSVCYCQKSVSFIIKPLVSGCRWVSREKEEGDENIMTMMITMMQLFFLGWMTAWEEATPPST